MKLDYARSSTRVTKPRAFSLDEQLFRAFAALCEREGRKQNRVLEALMRVYIEGEKGADGEQLPTTTP